VKRRIDIGTKILRFIAANPTASRASFISARAFFALLLFISMNYLIRDAIGFAPSHSIIQQALMQKIGVASSLNTATRIRFTITLSSSLNNDDRRATFQQNA